MTMLKDRYGSIQISSDTATNKNFLKPDESVENSLPLSYFDLLDEMPEYSEAAILLEDGCIEYCYIKIGRDGSQYFGFNCAHPHSSEHEEITSRHMLTETMTANTFEKYPSGKTILSKGGKIIEINMPERGKTNV